MERDNTRQHYIVTRRLDPDTGEVRTRTVKRALNEPSAAVAGLRALFPTLPEPTPAAVMTPGVATPGSERAPLRRNIRLFQRL